MELRRLTDADRGAVDALLAADPVAHCYLISRLLAAGGVARSGGDFMGAVADGALLGIAHAGGNLVPAGGDPAAMRLLGQWLAAQPRRSASVVGLAADVLPLWSTLSGGWGPAREERLNQPLLVATEPPSVSPAPEVRRAEAFDADRLYPATVAMFTEEVGVSPLATSSEAAYRARLMWLIRAGRVFCWFDDDGVLFKAEIAAVSPHTCQIQGVWVRPDRRNQGVGSAAMAALAELAADFAPAVSLYVNDYNGAALRVYARAGFRQVDTMASIHF